MLKSHYVNFVGLVPGVFLHCTAHTFKADGRELYTFFGLLWIRGYQILKEILKFVAPVLHFHFCQKYECLGAKNVVLHRPSVHFGLGTVSKVPCGNALLPSGHNVTSTNTGEAQKIDKQKKKKKVFNRQKKRNTPEGIGSAGPLKARG